MGVAIGLNAGMLFLQARSQPKAVHGLGGTSSSNWLQRKKPMTTPTTPHSGNKLNLPHGNAATAALDIDDIHSVQVILGEDGDWCILIVLKNGGSVVAAYSEENIAYLKDLGFEPQYPLGRPVPESEPKGTKRKILRR